MSKKISAGFSTALNSSVIDLAICLTLIRSDGRRFFLTNHDTELVVDGDTFQSSTGFVLSAVSTGSTLAADTCSIELGLDEVFFLEADFRSGRWKKAAVEIAQVNWSAPSNGKITLRRGVIRQIELKKNGSVRLDIDGLLKVLDFSVGRTYKAVCDAEFGDKRCRVAVDYSQHRSFLNVYSTGDWAYWYDTTEMTLLPVVNEDFADDGDRTTAQAITGWTKGPSSSWVVDDGGSFVVPHRDGDRVLAGGTDSDPVVEDQFVYQDLDLSSLSTAIDDGEIMFGLFVEVAQKGDTADYAKLRVDLFDAAGEVVQSETTNWFQLDTADAWRERAVVFHVVPDAVTARIYLEARRLVGSSAGVNFARVRAYTWDITADNPTHDRIFKVTAATRALDTRGALPWLYPTNPGFEVDGIVAESDFTVQDIFGWVKTAGYFRVQGSVGLSAANGAYACFAGPTDTASAIYSEIELALYNIDLDAVDAGEATLQWSQEILTPTTDGRYQVSAAFYDAMDVLISTFVAVPYTTNTTNDIRFKSGAEIPPDTRKVRLIYEFDDGGVPGENLNGVDDVQFYVQYLNAAPTVAPTDVIFSSGVESTVPDYVLLSNVADGGLTWRTQTQHVQTDLVDAVTDRKTFTATNMIGAAGTYETTKIRWLSGNNAGTENIVRIWNGDTQVVKLYYPQPADIQVGDRFQYVQGCQKRFAEDCVARFNNGVNFRGFPFVPGIIDE